MNRYIVQIYDTYLSFTFECLMNIIENVSSNQAQTTNKQSNLCISPSRHEIIRFFSFFSLRRIEKKRI
jgi:hypothetical protein